MNGTPWTPERTERLKELHAEGFSASMIAREFGGMTRNAVIGRIHRMIVAGTIPPRLLRRKETEQPPRRKNRNPKTVAVAPSVPPPKTETRRKHRRPCKLASLKLDSCRWPMWGADTPPKDWRFCNTIVPKGCSYCAEHYHMAYRPVRERQRDAA